jgi:hypothetical protein
VGRPHWLAGVAGFELPHGGIEAFRTTLTNQPLPAVRPHPVAGVSEESKWPGAGGARSGGRKEQVAITESLPPRAACWRLNLSP